VEGKGEVEIKNRFNGGVEENGNVEALIWRSLNAGFIRETIVQKFSH
jgi:hypothetical protein